MFEEIAREIRRAAEDNQKVAMLHFQVLTHARQLATTNAKEFCELVNIHASYATEVRKMLSLARLMGEKGVQIV